MEPVSMVAAALLAGASAGLAGTATDAIKDAYAGLKKLLHKAFTDQPDLEHAVRKTEEKPEAYKEALTEEVKASGVDNNPDIQAAADQLLTLIKQAGLNTAGTYTVTTHDHSQIGAVGPNAQVTMGSNRPPSNPQPQ